MAAQTYLITTQPAPDDPRATLHCSALMNLGMVGASLAQAEQGIMHQPDTHPHRRISPRQAGHTRRSWSRHRAHLLGPEPQSNTRGDNTQYRDDEARDENRNRRDHDGDNEDDYELCGASCFTQRIRKTSVPKDFKLPHDRQKYDGLQEPEAWLADYLATVKLQGGSTATAMQSLQLHLTDTARSWPRQLPKYSIGSSNDLEDKFIRHFQSIFK